jgi:hypothetical protein
MAVSDNPSTPRVARRRDAGVIAVSVAVAAAVVVGAGIAAVVLSGASAEVPSGERGRTVVERPFPDIQLPTL